MKPVLVGIGEFLWDLLPEGKRFGGAPANVAYHFQQLGGKGIIVSAVGADDLGRELMEQLHMLSLSREYVTIDNHHHTGIVSVTVEGKGIPVYDIQEDVAWDFIPSTSQLAKLAQKAEAVVFGTLAQRFPISRQTIQSFMSKVQTSAWCILDVNLRQNFYSREVIEASLRLSHILKLNESELRIIAKVLSLKGVENTLLAQLLKRYDLHLIALTRGEHGSTLVTSTQRSDHPGFQVDVTDTVGAGDAFTAALSYGMLEGQNLDTINHHANYMASYICSKSGATPPPSKEIQELITER